MVEFIYIHVYTFFDFFFLFYLAGLADVARQAGSPTAINDNSTTANVDSSSTKRNLKLLAPRILFTDDTFGT